MLVPRYTSGYIKLPPKVLPRRHLDSGLQHVLISTFHSPRNIYLILYAEALPLVGVNFLEEWMWSQETSFLLPRVSHGAALHMRKATDHRQRYLKNTRLPALSDCIHEWTPGTLRAGDLIFAILPDLLSTSWTMGLISSLGGPTRQYSLPCVFKAFVGPDHPMTIWISFIAYFLA